MILISEIFGPTIQGEGALIGTPTVFVRTAGCDFRCHWCDTLHAVDKVHREDWQQLSPEQVMTEVERLTKGQPILITLSGGNPATQDLSEFISLAKAKGYTFSMETQGSVSAPWFAQLDSITFSPKAPSSKMRFDPIRFDSSLLAAKAVSKNLKIVVADSKDLDWAGEMKDRHPDLPMFLQPCNLQLDGTPDQEVLTDKTRQLIEEVVNRGWFDVTVLPQLHVYLWGNEKGV